MRVARAGSGPLVIMMHGFPECWYSWRHQLTALSDKFDCVAPEMRGYGETDAPVGVENYRLDKLVGDVADLIEALGQKRAVIVGHDWGGGVAWATALMRPDVVDKLIVMNCPHLARFGHEVRRNPRQMLRSWYMLFFQIPALPEMLMRARNYKAIVDAARNTAIQKNAFSDADAPYYREAFKNPYSITAAINYYRANMREGLAAKPGESDWLERKIAAPTLLIWGEQDFALGKELTYNMEGLFTGPFTIKYIPDSGHWVQQEKPDLVNQYMREFLESK
ncbi:MAG TPA: alpha/beta hydrolase [Candidatus Binataceae bacterium]|nr:alpha/beta hydrolase [Candidatus Binataceae bacterium]